MAERERDTAREETRRIHRRFIIKRRKSTYAEGTTVHVPKPNKTAVNCYHCSPIYFIFYIFLTGSDGRAGETWLGKRRDEFTQLMYPNPNETAVKCYYCSPIFLYFLAVGYGRAGETWLGKRRDESTQFMYPTPNGTAVKCYYCSPIFLVFVNPL